MKQKNENIQTKLLYLYLKKVTKLTKRERVMVLCWLKMLTNPKIVMAPNKLDLENIAGMPVGENVILRKDGKIYKGILSAQPNFTKILRKK